MVKTETDPAETAQHTSISTSLSLPERTRLAELADGRLYPKSDKIGSTNRLVARGWAEWLEHAMTKQVFARITTEGLKANDELKRRS